MIESLLLSAFGAALGLALAVWGDRLLLAAYLPADSTDVLVSTAPDLRVLAFTFVVMLATALLFGLMPALQTSRPQVASTLKEQAGSVLGGTNVALRKLLVTAQVNFVQALYDYYVADAQLQRDTGLNDPGYLPRVPKAPRYFPSLESRTIRALP